MKKFSRRKMALALACASILGGKTQAMKEPQSQQNLAAVSGVTSSKFNKLTKKQKIAIGLGVGLGVVSIGVISTIIALAIKGKNSDNDNSNPTKAKNTTDELENKGKIQPENEKGEFYKKNQKMIQDGILKLDENLQKIYDTIKELILNYKEKKLPNYIEEIFDKIDDVDIKDPKKITDQHQEKCIGLLDEFIDIYSGKKELTKFSVEEEGLSVEVKSKDVSYFIFQNLVTIQKFDNKGNLLLSIDIGLAKLLG